MTDSPSDRAALVELMARAHCDSQVVGICPGPDCDCWEPELARMEAALRAAEEVGVFMQPDEPTNEMLGAGIPAYDMARLLSIMADSVTMIYQATHAAGPYRRKT